MAIRNTEESKQYSKGKFHNRVEWQQPSFFEFSGTMWDFIFKGGDRTPDMELPRKEVDLKYFNSKDPDGLNSTWVGHSSLMINIDGYRILTDPVYEKKVSFFGPTRFNGDVPLDPNKLENIDIVIVSHNHYDHMNKYSIKLLADKTKLFIVPLAVGAELERWGVPRGKIVEMDWWEEFRYDDKLVIAATPSQHFSGRGLTDRNKTLWASWVIRADNHNVYFSADGGYGSHFKEIGEKYGPFDMTFMECGAYNERWHHIHMYPEETIQAHIDVKGNIMHPIHWGTFNLALHAWYEPMVRASKAADEHNIKMATPVVGETTIFGEYIPSERWWEKSPATVEV